ncbi:MAG: hypothetical protein ETSY2_06500 [Candidatus Entotheonella gemina]|uniref:DUF4440 domain-containing protein n=1 Tax=Candidatus Entotheonella gemina TaxID=1429439 RepID=W4MEA0_9BACT|nr:MAG: hypothetical protein ETSY2_06500 [Candidatus Entotheonella gemina]
MNRLIHLKLGLFTLLVGLLSATTWADDVGITKARLVQQAPTRYVLEADVSQALLWAVKAPIFPNRFQVSELEFITQSGAIVVQATATTRGEPLSPRDEILLPWMRNGVSLTVQWLDGSIYQGLFMRTLEGIRVPVRLIMPSHPSLTEIAIEHFRTGGEHLAFKWLHLLFAFSMVLLWPSRQVFLNLLYVAFGHGLALILADVGLPGADLLLADLLGTLLIFLMAIGAIGASASQHYHPLFVIFGLLHGLAYAQELAPLELPRDLKLPALFMFTLAIDAGHAVAVGMGLFLLKALSWLPQVRTLAAYAVGSLSVAILITLFQAHVVVGQTDLLNFDRIRIATRFALPVSQNAQVGGQRPQGARQLTNAVMNYLSVEPYEVRQEILIQARAAVQFLGVLDRGMGSIPVESLEPVKAGILDIVQRANSMAIDGQPATPVSARADFVTLGPAGVMVRPEPVTESLDHGIIGITLVYETPALADAITIEWQLFSPTVTQIEAATIDPFGGTTTILSPDTNALQWKNRLSGYQVPVIAEIAVEKPRLPIVSILLFLAVVGCAGISWRHHKRLVLQPILASVLALGLVLYPFARFSLDLPWVLPRVPSTERTAVILDDLLTNIYRAFGVRNESRVYDRLATTVIGDQLSQIYLQNRRAMEFEDRGGARANVDDVNILAVDDIKRQTQEEFVADATWSVSGSVNHFGHTHYRQNRYHALITFVKDQNHWKLKDLELIDERRVF